ncbi:MAG: hypothetical protein AAFR87_13310 [Bacteroidota bacterium]
MKRFFFTFLLFPLILPAQIEVKIDDFSDSYYAIVLIKEVDKGEIFKPASVHLIEARTNRELIKIDAEEIVLELTDNSSSSLNIPYSKQSIIIYEDFNFDGVKDLALQDGQESCYHQSSYDIYLDKGDRLEFNESLTELAHYHCGMFQIDKARSRLITYAKSGCCYHEKSEYILQNDKALLRYQKVEDGTAHPLAIVQEKSWVNGSWKESNTTRLIRDAGELKIILSFKLKKNGKEVLVYSYNNAVLGYALEKPNKELEFNFPAEKDKWSGDKHFNFTDFKDEATLNFSNANAKYEIYQKGPDSNFEKIGIKVWVNAKEYHLEGDPESAKGSLFQLNNNLQDNVNY